MFLFNLSLPEFLALFGALSGVVVALYLLDRVKKKHTVASLRFFTVLDKVPQYRHRRKLQQPWSLLLQLLSLLMLLLAIAQLRLGSQARYANDHVLIMDTSAWMAAQTNRGRLIDEARAAARAYLKSLPANDRVMLVRADALSTPATQFISDRQILRSAIDATQPGASALNIEQAIDFARESQKLHAQKAGEIVFVGAGRLPSEASQPAQLPSNFRLIAIHGPVENCGLRKFSIRRSLTKPGTWEIFASVKNYGTTARSVPLVVGFGGARIASHRFNLAAGAEDGATFQYATRSAGWVEARLLLRDPFALDDRAVLELPSREIFPVTVYSSDSAALKPVFDAIPNVKATFLPPTSEHPTEDSIWIAPPAAQSPVAIAGTHSKVKLTKWRSDSSLASGLHTKDLELPTTEVFRLAKDDIAVAEADAGPIIVARPGARKLAVLGFQPSKYELTTPLLFANIIRWMSPDLFTSYELAAGTAGTVNVDLDSEMDPSAIRVVTEDQRRLPFTLDGKNLRFFSEAPGIVRVSAGDRELVYSLTLPQAGDAVWKPAAANTGIPRRTDLGPSSRDIWQWLALLGALGLVVDWFLFGRDMRRLPAPLAAVNRMPWRKAS